MVLLDQNPHVNTMMEKPEYLSHAADCFALKSTQCEFVMNVNRKIQIQKFRKSEKEFSHEDKSISLCKEDYYRVRKLILRSLTPKNKYQIYKRVSIFLTGEVRRIKGKKKICVNKSIQTDNIGTDERKLERKDEFKQIKPKESRYKGDQNRKKGSNIIEEKKSKNTIVLFDAREAKLSKEKDKLKKPVFPLKVLSAVDIRYAQVSWKLTSVLDKNESFKYRESLLHVVDKPEEQYPSKVEGKICIVSNAILIILSQFHRSVDSKYLSRTCD